MRHNAPFLPFLLFARFRGLITNTFCNVLSSGFLSLDIVEDTLPLYFPCFTDLPANDFTFGNTIDNSRCTTTKKLSCITDHDRIWQLTEWILASRDNS